MTELLRKAFDPEIFKQDLTLLTNAIHDYLKNIRKEPTYHHSNPNEEKAFWIEFFEQPFNYLNLIRTSIHRSIHIHNPKYIGHQVAAPAFMAIQQGLLADLLNNGMGVYEMGTVAVAWEDIIIDKLAAVAGFPQNASGFLTSGGSLANLTGLLGARSKYYTEKNPMAIMVSEMAHYSVSKSAKILNLQVLNVPVNDYFAMDHGQMEFIYRKAESNGIQIIAVVGSACSTATGSFDNLEAIRQFCNQKDLWFHVDGAHGGSLIFSDQYKHLVKGIETADSMIVDFHKMLLTPALCTAIIFRNGSDSYKTYLHKAEYLWQNEEAEWYNLAKRTFECTKFMMSFKVLPMWIRYGDQLFNDFVTTCINNTYRFAEIIRQHSDFELAVRPFCNILCFRYIHGNDLNALNKTIREKLISRGEFYIVQTTLKDQVYLRCTTMNPFTNEDCYQELLDQIVMIAETDLSRIGS